MRRSVKFEQQIHRIYKLLSNISDDVTWNEKIPDPDNPTQSRQIDVTVRRKDHITHIECRTHNKPQGVMWIEELMGRRKSLCADMVIAVSDSGFSEGAIKKAERYGIFLRDLKNISELEVSNWGMKCKVSISYYQLQNISCCFVVEDVNEANIDDLIGDLSEKTEYIDVLFNTSKYYLNQSKDLNYPLCVRLMSQEAGNMDLCGNRIVGGGIQAEIDVFEKSFDCSCVCEFQSVSSEGMEPMASVARTDILQAEIICSSSDEI